MSKETLWRLIWLYHFGMTSQAAELRSLLLLIVHSVLEEPAEMTVDVSQENGTIILELHVSSDDIGRLIGKQGRVARSIRTILTGAAMKSGVRSHLDISVAALPAAVTSG